jgi:hypothetical protein
MTEEVRSDKKITTYTRAICLASAPHSWSSHHAFLCMQVVLRLMERCAASGQLKPTHAPSASHYWLLHIVQATKFLVSYCRTPFVLQVVLRMMEEVHSEQPITTLRAICITSASLSWLSHHMLFLIIYYYYYYYYCRLCCA